MRQRMEKPVILTNTGKEQNWAPQKIEEKNHICETDLQSLITQTKIPWQVAT